MELIEKTIAFLSKIKERQEFRLDEIDIEFSRMLGLFNRLGFIQYSIKKEFCTIKFTDKNVGEILSNLIKIK